MKRLFIATPVEIHFIVVQPALRLTYDSDSSNYVSIRGCRKNLEKMYKISLLAIDNRRVANVHEDKTKNPQTAQSLLAKSILNGERGVT